MPRRAHVPDDQLSLFTPSDPLAEVYADARKIAARLPPRVRFGTSSWSYPGWAGLVFARARSESELARDGLAEYARHPLLTTVCIDRGYYAPVPPADYARYATQLPDGYLCCMKAPATVTSAIVPGSDRAGRALVNPDFLSVERFRRDMADAVIARFLPHAGPVLIEMPRVPRAFRPSPDEFADRLDAFLRDAPRELRYCVELRERELLTPAYAAVLRARRASHVYNWWTAMPELGAQEETVPVADNPFVVVRVVIPPGTSYDERKRALQPFDVLRDPRPEMRADVVAIARHAVALGRSVFVLVNNKAEGCSPATVRALAEMLVT